MSKIEIKTSKLVNPSIQLESGPRILHGLIEKFSPGLVSVNFNVPFAFL